MTIIPYSFTPGQKAKASEVNANFIALADKISENSEYAAQLNNLIDNVRTSVEETGNIKAELDLSNVDEEIDFVVESWKEPNGLGWYRKYRSGWIEQGGTLYMPAANTYYYINFPIPFSTIRKHVTATGTTETGQTPVVTVFNHPALEGFSIKTNTASTGCYWLAAGY